MFTERFIFLLIPLFHLLQSHILTLFFLISLIYLWLSISLLCTPKPGKQWQQWNRLTLEKTTAIWKTIAVKPHANVNTTLSVCGNESAAVIGPPDKQIWSADITDWERTVGLKPKGSFFFKLFATFWQLQTAAPSSIQIGPRGGFQGIYTWKNANVPIVAS